VRLGRRLWTALDEDRGGTVFLFLLAGVAILVPALNQLVPASSVFHLSTYSLTLIGKYLCYAMLALASISSGILRDPEPRPRRVSSPWRLCHGHVSHATESGPAA